MLNRDQQKRIIVSYLELYIFSQDFGNLGSGKHVFFLKGTAGRYLNSIHLL